MAFYFRNDEISAERTGYIVNVADNDIARLMYYLRCVCVAIDCDNDADIQPFTNYHNWPHLSLEEQRALVAVCYIFSPDLFNNKVFFHNDELCGDSENEFYTIREIHNQLLAVDSIIIAGRVRIVKNIMTYKIDWMKKYYFNPLRQLAARFIAPSHTGIPSRPTDTLSVIEQRNYCCRFFSILVVLLGIGIIVILILKIKQIF